VGVARLEAERFRVTGQSVLTTPIMQKEQVPAASPRSSWHDKPPQAVLADLNATPSGLTQSEAQARLGAHGVTDDKPRNARSHHGTHDENVDLQVVDESQDRSVRAASCVMHMEFGQQCRTPGSARPTQHDGRVQL